MGKVKALTQELEISEAVQEDVISAVQDLLELIYLKAPEVQSLVVRAQANPDLAEELLQAKADAIRRYTQRIERGGYN